MWVLRVIELEETSKHTPVQTETLATLFFPALFFYVTEKNKGFSTVMNACVHYFSESVCKYVLLSNFCQNTFSLNTIFQTIYESTSIQWNYPVSLSSVTLPPDPKGAVIIEWCLPSRRVPVVKAHDTLHTHRVFSKIRVTLLIFCILSFPLNMNSQGLYLHLINACGLGRFWHVYCSFIILHEFAV